MCWRLLLWTGVLVTAYRFDPHDQSDYIDNPDEPAFIKESAPIRDIPIKKEEKIEDEIKKLLGQPVLHYEDPAAVTADSAPASFITPTRSHQTSSTKPSQPRKLRTSVPDWSEPEKLSGRHKHTSKRARKRTSEVVYSVRVGQADDYPQVGQKFRPGVIESLVGAHDIVRFETRNYPTRPPYMHTTKVHHDPTRTPFTPSETNRPTRTLGTQSTAYITDKQQAYIGNKEQAYIEAFGDKQKANIENKKAYIGDKLRAYIEGKQKAYVGDKTAYTPTDKNVSWTAYNEGGVRSASAVNASGDGRRQYLVTLPAYLVTSRTKAPRPTPTSRLLTFKYPHTRRTRRNPNCTDSYYECLDLCFDRRGYRVKCPWYTPKPRPEPQRLNFTGLFWAIQKEKRITEYEVSNIFWSWKDQLIQKGYRSCRTFTPKSTTFPPEYPVYYDDALSKATGKIIAKCWVCGLKETGIPRDSNCFDNFSGSSVGAALAEKSSYRRYCRYMDEVPLWFNRSDPFSVWGQWTGGCSYRFLDLNGLYAQRSCRSTIMPATGESFLSKRLAMLELALRDQKEGCVVSPMATLVPFSRAISLYARFNVCVCRGNWCNHACHRAPSFDLLFICAIIRGFVR